MLTWSLLGMLAINLLHIALSSSILLHSSSMYRLSSSFDVGSLTFTLCWSIPHKFSTGQMSAILAAWSSWGTRLAKALHASSASLHLKRLFFKLRKIDNWPVKRKCQLWHCGFEERNLPVNDCTIVLPDFFELWIVVLGFDDRNHFLDKESVARSIDSTSSSEIDSSSTSAILRNTKNL